MSQHKPYPAYQKTDVEWIGKLPKRWSVARIKRHATLRSERCTEVPTGTTYIGLEDVEPETGKYKPTPGNSRQSEDSTVGIYRDLDVLYGKLRPYLRKSIVAAGSGVCSTEFLVLHTESLDPNWLHQWLLTPVVTQQIEAGCDGAKMPRADWEHVGSIPIPVPSKDEQTEIIKSMTEETNRIDALIGKKTRFIELLNEKRQALITRAVTKGIDPSVKMKDSEVEWIGKVPAHWDLSKLGFVTSEQGGKTPNTANDDYWDGGIPWVSPKDMKVSTISDSIDHVTQLAVEECGMPLIPDGAVLVVVRGMILAHSFPVAETGAPVTINQDMKALVPTQKMLCTYLRLVLQSAKSYVVSVLVAEAAHGTRVLRTDIWKQLPVMIPPVADQRSIIKYVESISQKYDRLASLTQRSIDLLKERRSAFITAAVTGQIDLREAA